MLDSTQDAALEESDLILKVAIHVISRLLGLPVVCAFQLARRLFLDASCHRIFRTSGVFSICFSPFLDACVRFNLFLHDPRVKRLFPNQCLSGPAPSYLSSLQVHLALPSSA